MSATSAPKINLGRVVGPRDPWPLPPCVDGARESWYARDTRPGHKMESDATYAGATRYTLTCVVCGLQVQNDSGD